MDLRFMVEKAKELCKTSPLTCTVLLSSDIGTAVKEVQAAFTNDPVCRRSPIDWRGHAFGQILFHPNWGHTQDECD